MVKSLEDYCLACIAHHITTYSRLGNCLSLRHKEVLLQRMCWHGQLTPDKTPCIFYHLFSRTLLRVHLSHSSQVDDHALELLGSSGCLPTNLIIHHCPSVTDKGLLHLTRILGKAEVLKLKKLQAITGKGLKSITTLSLRRVDLSESAKISDDGLTELVRNCPNIESLCLSELGKLTDKSLSQVAKNLGENLTELDCSDVHHITCQSTLALAEHCRNLTVANFEACVNLDGSGIIQMAERCDLTKLCISLCNKISQSNIDIIMSLLRGRGRLTSYEAMGLVLSSLTMEMLSTSCITSLTLSGARGFTDDNVELVTKTMGGALVELDLSNCTWLTNRAPAAIAQHCHRLERLGLRNLWGLNGPELSPLFLDSRAKNFSSIALSGSKNIPSSIVHHIATNCTNLETLSVASLKDIDDSVAFSLAQNCRSAVHISFKNCSVTDSGVCEVALNCPKLSIFTLSGMANLTDKSIIALAENCHELKDLYVSGCPKITQQAITYLKDCVIGHVFVDHATPNAPVGLLMGKDLDSGQYTRVDDVQYDSLYNSKLSV